MRGSAFVLPYLPLKQRCRRCPRCATRSPQRAPRIMLGQAARRRNQLIGRGRPPTQIVGAPWLDPAPPARDWGLTINFAPASATPVDLIGHKHRTRSDEQLRSTGQHRMPSAQAARLGRLCSPAGSLAPRSPCGPAPGCFATVRGSRRNLGSSLEHSGRTFAAASRTLRAVRCDSRDQASGVRRASASSRSAEIAPPDPN